jgi:hypothetical protein
MCSGEREDPRTRRDRINRRTDGFALQMNDIVDAYIEWSYTQSKLGPNDHPPEAAEETIQGTYKVQVVDVFRTCFSLFHEL